MLRLLCLVVSAVLAVALAPQVSAEPYGDMTVTLVRHGESEANVAGIVATAIPGPPLTALGEQQAKRAAQLHSEPVPDAVFASPLLRTRQTAQPLADELGDPVQIQDGLREVEGGAFEGQPVAQAGGYLDAIQAWARGDRTARIPGSIDGNELDERFDSALEAIWSGGYTKPVVYSHGAAIVGWTLMNVDNPPAKITGLNNTGYVVVHGNPKSGWTLVDWVDTPPA